MKPRHTQNWQPPVVLYDDPEAIGAAKRPYKIVVFGNGSDIVHVDLMNQPGTSFQERLANARIIGAGTKMLEALQLVVGTMKANDAHETECMSRVREAIGAALMEQKP